MDAARARFFKHIKDVLGKEGIPEHLLNSVSVLSAKIREPNKLDFKVQIGDVRYRSMKVGFVCYASVVRKLLKFVGNSFVTLQWSASC